MHESNITLEQSKQLNYDGELTLEALSVLDTYSRACCNVKETSRKINKQYIKVRKYLKQPYVRELFKLRLMECGVTPERIAETIKNGLTASNGVYYEGALCADEPNWAARNKFAQLAAEIFEVLKYTNKGGDTNVNVGIVITPEDRIELARIRGEISNLT